MTDEAAFFRQLDDLSETLPARTRAALAAAAAERGLASLHASGGLSCVWLERAVELTWSFALGEEVPFDLHREVRHEVEELLDDRAYDVLAREDDLGHAIRHALAVLDPEDDPLAMARGLERAIDGAASREEALAWSSRAIARASSPTGGPIERTTFGADDDAEARRARVAAWRLTHQVVPWREPSGVPRRLVALEIGRAPSGREHYGLFARDEDTPGFSVPDAVAYGMSPDERTLYAWRAPKGRWLLELHAWPARTLEVRHEIHDPELITTCLPRRLEVPREGEGRVAILRARGDDFACDLFVVDTPTGIRETVDREEALTWAREWKDVT